MKKFNLN